MARKAYIGVGNKARNVKKIYVSARMLNNLIPYSDMEGSGWSTGNGVSYSTERAYAGTRSLKMVGASGSAETTCNTAADVQLNNAHFYYAAVFGWQDTKTNGARVGFYWPIAEPSFNDNIPVREAGQWVRYSATNNRSGFANGGYPFRLDWNNGGTEGTIYYDGAMLIDLTAEFGSGNEPTKEWCDKHIYFTASGQVCVLDMDETSTVNQVKKAYIGIGGKARPCWGEGKPVYFGTVNPLKTARRDASGEYVGEYFLIAGGQKSVYAKGLADVDAYNKSLVKVTVSDLSEGRTGIATGGFLDNTAIFWGGGVRNGNYDSTGSKKIDFYTADLVHQYQENATTIRQNTGGRAGGVSIFTGGPYGGESGSDWSIYLIGPDKVVTTIGSQMPSYQKGQSTGNYFIATRSTDSGSAWNEDGVHTELSPMPVNAGSMTRSPSHAGSTVLFAGGYWESALSYVGTYSDDLTFSAWPRLPRGSFSLSNSASTGDFAIFAGGRLAGSGDYLQYLMNNVTSYSKDGVRLEMEPLEYQVAYMAGTGKDGVALVAGGYGAKSPDTNTQARAEVYAYIVE